MSDKYAKVRHDAQIFEKKCEYAEYGHVFRCQTCGLKRYLLGKEAKYWNGEWVGCKSCGQLRIEHKDKMQQRQAVHFNNIKSRKTDITAHSDTLINK